MEEQFYADRAALQCLMRTQPYGTQQQWAMQLGRSLSWIKKWVKRLRAVPPGDTNVLRGAVGFC